jgi:hypothetical protein
MIENQNDNGSNHSYEQAIQIYACNAVGSEHTEKPAAHYRTDDSQHDIKDDAFARFIYQLAAYETSNQAQHNPCKNRHKCSPLFAPLAPFGSVPSNVLFDRTDNTEGIGQLRSAMLGTSGSASP